MPITQLEEFIASHTNKTIAVAVDDLETDRQILINENEAFHPASTFKVHVMMEVFRVVHEGMFSIDWAIPIINSFTSIADGSKYSLDVNDDSEKTLYQRLGQNETIRELTRLMIVQSSNLATNILMERVSAKNVNAFIQSLGIEGVIVRRGVEDNAAFQLGLNNSATANGLTQTMKLIADGHVISRKISQEMIKVLLGQQFNESIPALLPASVKVAHKTGWTDDVYHDTGIVFPEKRKPYAISIMTRGFPEDSEKEAHSCMAAISKMIYEQIV